MAVIATRLEVGIARLLPEDAAARESDDHQSDAAEKDIEMKLSGEEVLEHAVAPEPVAEPEAEADHAERAGQTDHAKLIDEIAVGFVM